MWKRKFKKNYARRSRVAFLWISEKKMKKYPDRKNVDREKVFFVNLCVFFYKMTKYQRQNAIEGDLFLVVDFRIFKKWRYADKKVIEKCYMNTIVWQVQTYLFNNNYRTSINKLYNYTIYTNHVRWHWWLHLCSLRVGVDSSLGSISIERSLWRSYTSVTILNVYFSDSVKWQTFQIGCKKHFNWIWNSTAIKLIQFCVKLSKYNTEHTRNQRMNTKVA